MSAYYNEFDPFAAAWLRELIKDGLIADGEVDERSITEVKANDIKEFTQCHFFAGIGGWSHALRLANWPDDKAVWTGSPPCQPFSSAGKQKGKDDERHLWPVFFNLIRQCKPPTIYGEQVASAIRTGWLDDLQTDLEAENYAAGAIVLPAASVGAPHKRERLFFVAHASNTGLQRHGQPRKKPVSKMWQGEKRHHSESGANDCTVGDTQHNGPHGDAITSGIITPSNNNTQRTNIPGEPTRTSTPRQPRNLCYWENSRQIDCRDGKNRTIPTEPAFFPLAHGVSNRVGILRGAGNAIVPQVAAEVIKASMNP